eukprot:857735-Ditylum_brightwellii.AAC.1
MGQKFCQDLFSSGFVNVAADILSQYSVFVQLTLLVVVARETANTLYERIPFNTLPSISFRKKYYTF